MKNMQRAVRSFARKHPHAVLVVTAASLVVALAAVETSGVLPLEGQATPMYGPLKTPGSSSSRAASVSSKSKSLRVITRVASPSSLRGAAPSSVATKAWTGKECSGGKRSSEECLGKLREAAKGDMACFLDESCYDAIQFCRLTHNECAALSVRKWAYDALFPGCSTDECAADVTALMQEAPKPLAECLLSAVCRELLADFRRGEFACRRYEPCLDALGALTAAPWCDASSWCKNMKTIDARYTKYATKCVDGPTAECRKAISIDPFASKGVRRVPCDRDNECRDDADELADALAYGNMGRKSGRAVECFLWPQCKKSFELSMRWACETVNREPDCGNHKAIHEFLTKTRPSCVFGYTASCKAEMEALLK